MATAVKPRLTPPRTPPIDDTLQFSPTPLQDRFITDVFSGKWRFFGLGGAIRGGKTISVVECLFLLCKIFPGSRWAIVRKDLPRIRRNTIPTIEKFAPRPFVGKLDKAEWKYRCANGSEILLIAEQLPTDPDLDRFKGLEVNGFVLEEANEVSEQTANKCTERLGSWIIRPTDANPHPKQPPALILATFNPADNWVREWFYDPWREGRIEPPYYFLPALPTDNPYNTEEQWAAWRELPAEQYQRFIEGDWAAIIDPYQLLTYAQVMEAANVEPERGRKREGLDVASGGDDDTVFCLIDGNVIDGAVLEVHHHWDEPTTAERARQRMQLHGIAPADYVVDSVGIGSGVYNMLRRWGRPVRAFVAGGKAVTRLVQPEGGPTRNAATGISRERPPVVKSMFTFFNLRSQAW